MLSGHHCVICTNQHIVHLELKHSYMSIIAQLSWGENENNLKMLIKRGLVQQITVNPYNKTPAIFKRARQFAVNGTAAIPRLGC